MATPAIMNPFQWKMRARLFVSLVVSAWGHAKRFAAAKQTAGMQSKKGADTSMTPQETSYLQKHILICTGESCGPQGGAAVRGALKNELRARNVRQLYREGECTCLGLCREGVNAVVWPEGRYLAGLTIPDVPRLVDYIEGKGARLSDLEKHASEKINLKKQKQ